MAVRWFRRLVWWIAATNSRISDGHMLTEQAIYSSSASSSVNRDGPAINSTPLSSANELRTTPTAFSPGSATSSKRLSGLGEAMAKASDTESGVATMFKDEGVIPTGGDNLRRVAAVRSIGG